MTLTIHFVSETFPASRSVQRLAGLRSLGHRVLSIPVTPPGVDYETPPAWSDRVRYRLRRPADRSGANAALLRVGRDDPASIIWLDNAKTIRPRTLSLLAQSSPRPRFVWFSEDDMMNPLMGSVWLDRTLGLFDLWVTTKSFNAEPGELPAKGARKVLFVDNAFDPALHHPEPVGDEERHLLGADISFIGTFERPRAESLLALAHAGHTVRIWGNGWSAFRQAHANLRVEDRPVYGAEFRKTIGCSAINLGFLRKSNRDRQTCRSIEVPACGGFMLHEHTEEMTRIFAPDEAAAYFRDDRELIEACGRWLRDPAGRHRVAAAGHRRVHALGLDHASIMARVLRELDMAQ
jgi:spore maturation protein CgeB